MLSRVKTLIGLGFALLVVAVLLIGAPASAKSQPQINDQSMAVPAELLPPSMGEPIHSAAPARASLSIEQHRDESPRPAVGKAAPEALLAPVTFDLCAKAGTVTMPDSTVIPIWGFALKPSGVPCSDASVMVGLPGPQLEATAGDSVTINLHNELAENVSLIFPGQDLIPDPVGAAANGGTVSYTFTATNPGTYLYESGANATIQVSMGLYGALIVRPATPGQAYDGAGSAYDQEAVLVLSEIDPALNNNPTVFHPVNNPTGFNMFDYAPKYWLINGKAYPDTALIAGTAGERVLLRYLNAGSTNHTMSLIGMHQRVIATDAYELSFPYDVVAQTIPAGQTADMIATVPADATVGARFPLYNRQLHVTNVAAFPGGMMTFLEVPSLNILAQGWNLMSVPLAPGGTAANGIGTLAQSGSSPGEVLGSIDYNRVYAYNGCDAADPWKLYDPNLPPAVNDLQAIDQTMGLWVDMNSPDTLSLTGSEPARTDIPLCAGWNLVGYPSLQTRPVSDVVASIAAQVVRVYYYDAQDIADPWKMWDPSVPAFVNDLKVMKPGGGYWIYVKQSTVLTIQN